MHYTPFNHTLPSRTGTQRTPLPFAGVSVTAVAAVNFHMCAVSSGGGLWCWGGNDYGELGIGSTAEQHSPVAVSLGAGVSCCCAADCSANACQCHHYTFASEREGGGGEGERERDWHKKEYIYIYTCTLIASMHNYSLPGAIAKQGQR